MFPLSRFPIYFVEYEKSKNENVYVSLLLRYAYGILQLFAKYLEKIKKSAELDKTSKHLFLRNF